MEPDNSNTPNNLPEEPGQQPAPTAPVMSSAPQSEPETPTQPNSFEPKVIPPHGGHKKYYRHVFLVLLILVMGALAWWFLIKDKNQSTTPTPTSNTQTSTNAETAPTTPDNVVYAFKAKDSDPYTVYIRPANGGKRTEAKILSNNEQVLGGDVYGQNAVFATSKAIYVSTDSGASFSSILTLGANEQVTSIKLSSDGKTIVYGNLTGTGGKNTVKAMDLTGKNVKELFTSTKAGVYLVGYSTNKQKIIYREGCANCDGTPELPVLRDLKTDKKTNLLSSIKANDLGDTTISSDFTTLVYVQSTENSSAPAQALGVFTGPPYTINTVDLSDSKMTKVDTIGTKGEKSANGTLRTRIVHAGFVIGASTPYYTSDKQLFTVKAGSPTLTYEATKNILFVPFVGTGVVITGSGADTSDYVLSNYNLSTKKSASIFSGDNNTIIFGVTTK